MLRASILLFILAFQINASHFRNSSAVKSSKNAPVSKKDKEDAEAIGGLVKGLESLANGATGEAGAAMRRKYMTRSQALFTNSKNVTTTGQNKKKVEDKEEKEAIAGLVNGLSKLPMQGDKVSPIGARIANLKNAALVSSGNATKALTTKGPNSKEDKENDEAIAGLVNGLNKLPMRNGKASPVAARMANLKNTALVSHAAPTAEAASKDANRIQRAQHALDKADEAAQSVEQEAAEARKDAESTKEALKTTKAATALVSSKATPAQKAALPSASSEQKPTKPQTPKTQKEDKEEKEAVDSFVNGLAKIPMKNGKISPIGVRMATRKGSALVAHAANPDQPAAASSAKIEQKPTKPQTPKTQKEDKEEKKAVDSFVNGLAKIPMKNGKISPHGVRMATRKGSALVSHAAPPAQKAVAPVDAQDARIQHALELADEEEKSVAQEEKEAHEEAEEARKLVKGPSSK